MAIRLEKHKIRKMNAYDTKNCPLCRLMRSLAFSGVGAMLGSGTAYLLNGSKQTIMLAGVITAAILVFGIMEKRK